MFHASTTKMGKGVGFGWKEVILKHSFFVVAFEVSFSILFFCRIPTSFAWPLETMQVQARSSHFMRSEKMRVQKQEVLRRTISSHDLTQECLRDLIQERS